jgi:undecaprenyl-diphosphatase
MLALIVYFYKDIAGLARLENKPLLFAIIAGTVPGVVAGLFLEDIMGTLFRNAHLVAYALIVGSGIMLAAEWWGPKLARTVQSLTWRSGLIFGLFQALAVVPGMSRSGMTTAGGMFLGFTRAESTYFGFLLSVPILVGAGLKKLYELFATGAATTIGSELILGSILAFLVGITTIHAFLILVRNTPLTVFVVYRLALAVLLLAFL